MFALSEQAKHLLEKQTQSSFERLTSMSLDEEFKQVENVIGKPLTFPSERKKHRAGRGNPRIARYRIKTMKDVERGIDRWLAQ